jgi:ABC-2 type transport system permease protein
MAIGKQALEPYRGSRTRVGLRFAVIFRYGLGRVFRSRLAWIALVLGALPPVLAGAMIYMRNDASLLPGLRLAIEGFVTVDARFFAVLMGVQSTFAFFMAVLTGPGLVSPDLIHGALPLYLSRPISRAVYAFGKFLVLALVLSFLTWVPGLLLYLLQSLTAGNGWFFGNGRIALGVTAGSLVWIVTISLLSLAISAWVRWRPVAGALMVGIFFVGSGLGVLFDQILDTDWGALLSLSGVITAIWQSLFLDTVFEIDYPLPVWTAWCAVALVWGASIGLLSIRLRPAGATR